MPFKRSWDRSRIGQPCPVCRVNPIQHAYAKTCGRSCGAASRTDRALMRVRADNARAVQRANYFKRVQTFFEGEIAALAALGRPIRTSDLQRAFARVYQRAFTLGVHYELNRWRSGRAGRRIQIGA